MKYRKHAKLLYSLLATLLLSLCLFAAQKTSNIFAANIVTIDGVDYDLDNLDVYKGNLKTSGTEIGITYEIYESGLCVLSGTQNNNSSDGNHRWNNSDVKIIYADYNCDGYSQYRMFSKSKMSVFLTGDSFNTSNVTNMSVMFDDCSKLTTLDVSKFDTSKVTNMSSMFRSCSGLKTLDLSNFNTSNVTDMSWMFDECSELTTLDVSKFDTSKVTNMSLMFFNCSGLTALDVSEFNTSNVTDMKWMLYGCSGLTTLDVSNFNTSNVTDMSLMFEFCSGLTTLDVSNFNTSNVTDMHSMFDFCSGLTTLDVSNFNTSNVTDMHSMFYGCSGLTTLDLSNFNTSNVTDMSSMFYGCSGLTTLDVSNFNTSNVTSMSSMFEFCSGLTTLDLSNFDTSKVINMFLMFNGCSKLTTLDVSKFDTSIVVVMFGMFDGCDNLKMLNISNKFVINSDCYILYCIGDYNIEFYNTYLDDLRNGTITSADLNLEDYCERYTYGLARNCPKLDTIIIDSNFNGLDYSMEIQEKNWDDTQGMIPVFNPSIDNYGPGRLFFTEKVNGQKVPLNFVVLDDASSNDKIAKLGTPDDSYYAFYEEDNREVHVLYMTDLDAFKDDLVNKDYINDKDINKEMYDAYQDMNSYFKKLLDEDTTIIKDSKTYKDLIQDLINAYNSFNTPSGGGGGSSSRKKSKETTKVEPTPEETKKNIAYMKGYDDKTFKPNKELLRVEIAIMIARLKNSNIENEDYRTYSNYYTDLPLNWYDNYIGYLTKFNIFEGYEDKTFKPARLITKGEFASIMVRMYDLKKLDGSKNTLEDLSDKWYKDSVEILYSNGFIDDSYVKDSDNSISREEACRIINKVEKRNVKTKETLTSEELKYINENFNDISTNDPYYYDILTALLTY